MFNPFKTPTDTAWWQHSGPPVKAPRGYKQLEGEKREHAIAYSIACAWKALILFHLGVLVLTIGTSYLPDIIQLFQDRSNHGSGQIMPLIYLIAVISAFVCCTYFSAQSLTEEE
jgi:hypothetical protein